MVRVGIAAVSGSLSIIVTTLDAVLDVISGFIIWSTSLARQRRNKYRFPIGQVSLLLYQWPQSMGIPTHDSCTSLYLCMRQFVRDLCVTNAESCTDPQVQVFTIAIKDFPRLHASASLQQSRSAGSSAL